MEALNAVNDFTAVPLPVCKKSAPAPPASTAHMFLRLEVGDGVEFTGPCTRLADGRVCHHGIVVRLDDSFDDLEFDESASQEEIDEEFERATQHQMHTVETPYGEVDAPRHSLRPGGVGVYYLVGHHCNVVDEYRQTAPGRLVFDAELSGRRIDISGVLMIGSDYRVRLNVGCFTSMTCPRTDDDCLERGIDGIINCEDERVDATLRKLTQERIQHLASDSYKSHTHEGFPAIVPSLRPGDVTLVAGYDGDEVSNFFLFRDRRVIANELWSKARRWLQAWRVVSYMIKVVGENQGRPNGKLGKRFRLEFEQDFVGETHEAEHAVKTRRIGTPRAWLASGLALIGMAAAATVREMLI